MLSGNVSRYSPLPSGRMSALQSPANVALIAAQASDVMGNCRHVARIGRRARSRWAGGRQRPRAKTPGRAMCALNGW